jgi:hypothetical protein
VINQEQLEQLSQFGHGTVLAIQASHQDQVRLLDTVQHNQSQHIELIKSQSILFENILQGLSENMIKC